MTDGSKRPELPRIAMFGTFSSGKTTGRPISPELKAAAERAVVVVDPKAERAGERKGKKRKKRDEQG